MQKIPHFVWATDIGDKLRHFSDCKILSEPFISLSTVDPDTIAITVDILPMLGFYNPNTELLNLEKFDEYYQDNLDKIEYLINAITILVKSYCEISSLPEDEPTGPGTNGAFSVLADKEHAETIADELYSCVLCYRQRAES